MTTESSTRAVEPLGIIGKLIFFDGKMLTRTWEDVMRNMEEAYTGSTLVRWQKQMRCEPFAALRKVPLLDTESSHFLTVLQHPRAGTSTHKWLRIVHNRALDLAWLLTPVMARRVWPKLRTKKTKAVTEEQHLRMVAAVKNEEFRHYLEMLWLIGGAQTDTARLHRDNIDLIERRMTYGKQPRRYSPATSTTKNVSRCFVVP